MCLSVVTVWVRWLVNMEIRDKQEVSKFFVIIFWFVNFSATIRSPSTKYWGKNYFAHRSFPEVGQKQKTEKKEEREKERETERW